MNRYTLLATALAAAVVCVAGWGLAAAVPQIKVGDKIVVLHDTHVQAESERLAPLKSGTELVAAQLSGVKVTKVKIISYVMSGMLAAFAGMLGAAYMTTARCQIFDDYAYDSLIAVIIGGTAFSGGIGSYQGSIAGSLVMILLSNLLTTLQLTQPVQNVTQGVIMILLLMLYNRSKSVRQ